MSELRTYRCWCPTDNRLPNQDIPAESSFDARKVYSAKHHKQVSECASRVVHEACHGKP